MSEFEKQLTSPLFGPLLSHCANSLSGLEPHNKLSICHPATNIAFDPLTNTHSSVATVPVRCMIHGTLPVWELHTNMSNKWRKQIKRTFCTDFCPLGGVEATLSKWTGGLSEKSREGSNANNSVGHVLTLKLWLVNYMFALFFLLV